MGEVTKKVNMSCNCLVDRLSKDITILILGCLPLNSVLLFSRVCKHHRDLILSIQNITVFWLPFLNFRITEHGLSYYKDGCEGLDKECDFNEWHKQVYDYTLSWRLGIRVPYYYKGQLFFVTSYMDSIRRFNQAVVLIQTGQIFRLIVDVLGQCLFGEVEYVKWKVNHEENKEKLWYRFVITTKATCMIQ